MVVIVAKIMKRFGDIYAMQDSILQEAFKVLVGEKKFQKPSDGLTQQ